MERITIDKQGTQWIATDGEYVCEAAEPEDAMHKLLEARDPQCDPSEWDEERHINSLEQRLDIAVGRLQRLLITQAPRVVVEGTTRLIAKLAGEIVDTYEG